MRRLAVLMNEDAVMAVLHLIEHFAQVLPKLHRIDLLDHDRVSFYAYDYHGFNDRYGQYG